QATQFAFDRDTAGMRHLHRATGHVDVVLVAGWRLAVFAERAVHHDRGKAQLNGALAYRRAGAVVLVHAYRDVRKLFDGGKDQVAQEGRTSILAGTGRGLDDHRGVGLVSRFHDRAHLLEVVDVEGRDAVAVLGSVVQHLAQADQSHD